MAGEEGDCAAGAGGPSAAVAATVTSTSTSPRRQRRSFRRRSGVGGKAPGGTWGCRRPARRPFGPLQPGDVTLGAWRANAGDTSTNGPEPIGWHPPPDGHPTKRGVTRTELNTTTDEQLVAAMQRDPAALEEFYRRHLLALTRFATSRLSDPARVADVVAATFLTALESTDRYDRARGRPIAWLLGIATNLIAADRRARAREAEALRRAGGQRLLEPDDYTRLDEQIDAARRYQDLNPTLDRLSPAEREMLTLVGEHGLTPSEAAAALGIGAVAARMRLARARRRISRAAPDLTARQALRQPSPSGAAQHGAAITRGTHTP